MSYLVLLFLAAGPSTDYDPGSTKIPAPHTIWVPGSGTTVFSIPARVDAQVFGASWVTAKSGVDGGVLLVNLKDDGVAVCTITVACSAPLDTVVTQACGTPTDGIVIAQGSVVAVTVDRSGCPLGSPEGHLTYTIAR